MRSALLLLTLLLLGGCHPAPAQELHKQGVQQKQVVEFTATVVRVPVEGGFYGLRADDGRQYEPRNLPASMRRAGLRVKVRGVVITGAAGFRQWGPKIDLLHIESR